MDDQHAGGPGAHGGLKLGAGAAGIGHAAALEPEVLAALEIRIIGEDDGDFARHVDAAIRIITICRHAEAGEHQRQVGKGGVTGVLQR